MMTEDHIEFMCDTLKCAMCDLFNNGANEEDDDHVRDAIGALQMLWDELSEGVGNVV